MFNQEVLKKWFKCKATKTGLDIKFEGENYQYNEDKDIITYTQEGNVHVLFDNGEVDSTLYSAGNDLKCIWQRYKNGLCLYELQSLYPHGKKSESLVDNDPDSFCYYVASNIIAHINNKWLGVIWIDKENNDEYYEFMVNASNDLTKIDNDEDRELVKKIMKEISPYF